MLVEIQNLTLRPVLMRLNSGASLHLSPGMTSDAIAGEEVARNAKVEKLKARRVIAVIDRGDTAGKAPGKSKSKSSTQKK